MVTSVPGVIVVFEGTPILTVTPPGGGVGKGMGRICGGSVNKNQQQCKIYKSCNQLQN